MAEWPSPEEIIQLIQERGRDGRQLIFDLDSPDKTRRVCTALELAKSAQVRRVLCNLLASLADPEALPQLLAVLNDPDPEVVAAAADAAGNSAYDHPIPHDLRTDLGTKLMSLARNKGQPIKVHTGAIYALGLMRYHPALYLLLNSLESDTPAERWASAEALAHIGDKAAVSALRVRRAKEDDERVKHYVEMALAELTKTEA
jgi:HEAT repeat protein